MTAAAFVVLIAVYLAILIPVFVIGRRSGVRHAWAAFIPFLGAWIVLFEALGRSGWLSLISFVPSLGPLVLLVWTAVELPTRQDRSRWWTFALLIPGVNLVAYWFYAFTLSHKGEYAVA